jgi:hypothetical protein
VQEAGPGVETVEARQVPTPALTNDRSKDIANMMRALNVDVDNDNKPAPENIPTPDDQPAATTGMYGTVNGKVLLLYVHVKERKVIDLSVQN